MTGMTPEEEAAFAAMFVQDYDNGPPGALWLFYVNPDGSRRIARPEDVLGFIRHLLVKRQVTEVTRVGRGCSPAHGTGIS